MASQLAIQLIHHQKIPFEEFRRANLGNKYKSYEDTYNENTLLRNQISSLMLSNTILSTENIELKNKIAMLTKQIEDQHILLTEIDKLKHENEELKSIIANQNIEIDTLKLDNVQLKEEVKILKIENTQLKEEVKILKIENIQLKEEVNTLKIENTQLKVDIKELKDDKALFIALSKLNDCDKLSNDKFKDEYRKYFKLKKYDNNIPNLGQFVDNPPDQIDDPDEYQFWDQFCKKYPNSDNRKFRQIYLELSDMRVNYGAHHNINDITKKEFDELMQFVLPKLYANDRKTCEEYREWLYLF